MPRLPRLFGRKQVDETATPPRLSSDAAETPVIVVAGMPAALDVEEGSPELSPSDGHETQVAASDWAADNDELPTFEGVKRIAVEPSPPTTTAATPPKDEPMGTAGMPGWLHEAASRAEQVEAPLVDRSAVPISAADSDDSLALGDRRSSSLIGGEEVDIVPVIPDTVVDPHDRTGEFGDDDTVVTAVDALYGACDLAVTRVKVIRKQQEGTKIISGLIALVTELDTRYTNDWGIVRRNGLEEVLIEVRRSIVEGDRFILESLENGRGGLSADVFLRDLQTIAPSDRPRMVASYAMFLVYVIKCVLRQYLKPLDQYPGRLREVTRGLDYLMEGVRDTLLARINGLPRMG